MAAKTKRRVDFAPDAGSFRNSSLVLHGQLGTPQGASAYGRAAVPLCLEAGRVTPASVADHVTPHRGDYTAFRLGALRSLCAACHNRLDSANNAPRYPPVREDGTPTDPRHPWNIGS